MKKTEWHHLSTNEVAHLLGTDLEQGLSDHQVAERVHEFGYNRITTPKEILGWKKFLKQFTNPIACILLIASIVSALIGQFIDATVIFAVIFINAIVGYLQEMKAEKALQALSKLVTTNSSVLRNGKKLHIPSEKLVPGDIVYIKSGDSIPADIRLIKAHNLQIDESTLTGESLPVHKHSDPLALDTLLADRKNLSYNGTLVISGQATGIVWAIGDQTQVGRIALLISETEELSTPLTKKLTHFSKVILWAILTCAFFTFTVGILQGKQAVEMFLASIAIAVGAIPEGLPAAFTIVLAIGVSRMAKKQAIIRKLPAVETLGSTTVICSDKTGTLTKNQMTVLKIFSGSKLYDVTGSGYDAKGYIELHGAPISINEHPQLLECLRAGVLCNESELIIENAHYKVQGDPTEAAMLVAAEKAGLVRMHAHHLAPRLDMIPFESEYMYRATLHESDHANVIYKVGALERLIDHCQDMLDDTGNLVMLDKAAIQEAANMMAISGMRVLAFARRITSKNHRKLHHEHVSSGLTFLGLQAMIDPPRPEVIKAIHKCHEAGISVKMVTGDDPLTARAIAAKIGLKERLILTGADLQKLSDQALMEKIDSISVFARITPQQKLRLVRAYQAKGHVIAMTGDGVNDAPALKQADIGIAMGISGTEVAKQASDIILTDDNFASIEAAVEEGRAIFDNLMKFLVWTLPTNAGEALILLMAIVLGTTLPVLPVQILWINMPTAIFLGLTLVFEPKERGLMQRPPRDPKQPILTHEIIMRTGLVSLIMLCGAFWLFFWELDVEGNSLEAARTSVVSVIIAVEIAYLFTCRSLTHSLFHIGVFSNYWSILGVIAMVLVQLLFTYLPVMNTLFHSAPISFESWLRIGAVSLITFAVVELEKWCRFRRKRS